MVSHCVGCELEAKKKEIVSRNRTKLQEAENMREKAESLRGYLLCEE